MNAGTPIDQDASVTRAQAWLVWLGSLLAPAVFLLAAMGVSGMQTSPDRPVVGVMITGVATLWLVFAVPGAMILRSHVLKGQMAGQAISGRRYVKGMGTIWGAAAVGGVLAGLSCLAGGGLMPGGVPWLIAVITIMAFSPGKAALL